MGDHLGTGVLVNIQIQCILLFNMNAFKVSSKATEKKLIISFSNN